MAAPRVPAAIALGSNLGNREAHLAFAMSRLRSVLHNTRRSTLIETAPEGVPDEQAPFLNGVVVGETDLSPRELLGVLQQIEQEAGRTRPYRYAARTLDLDLISVRECGRGGGGAHRAPSTVPRTAFRAGAARGGGG